MITLVAALMFGMAMGQESAPESPCSQDVVIKGRETGWYRLPPKEIPKYFKLRFECWKAAWAKKPSLNEQVARGGFELRSQRPMHGWTNTHAAIVTLTISYYYIYRSLK